VLVDLFCSSADPAGQHPGSFEGDPMRIEFTVVEIRFWLLRQQVDSLPEGHARPSSLDRDFYVIYLEQERDRVPMQCDPGRVKIIVSREEAASLRLGQTVFLEMSPGG
jgi:hypothetical protein